MNYRLLVALLLSLSPCLPAADTQRTIDETRLALEKWVEQRRELADRKAAWAVEKKSLEQSIQLYEKELADLDERIKTAQEQSSEADRVRVELEDKDKLAQEAAVSVEKVINGFESQLLKVAKGFPDPLQRKIGEFLRKIPDPANRENKSLGERMQVIVAILGEVDKFNNSVTTDTEFRKVNGGTEVSVETIYLGLGQSYFVAREGDYAGVGFPGAEKWEWVERRELAPKIREAFAMYQNLKPAEFVGLDVTVK